MAQSRVLPNLAKKLREGNVLVTKEYIIAGKRVENFTGKDFVQVLTNYDKVGLKNFKVESPEEIVAIGKDMIRAGYFHRSNINPQNPKLCQIHPEQTFVPEGIYTWVLEPSPFQLYAQTAGLIVCILFVCCIKVWPLWLKIAIWWLSVIFLVAMISILIVRLILFVIFYALGYKGLWLFPNLLDEELGVWESMTPVFGYGDEHIKPSDLKKKLKQEPSAEQKAAAEANAKAWTEDQTFRKGIINTIALLLVAGVAAYYTGFFGSEFIPQFVATKDDIFDTYPNMLPEPEQQRIQAERNSSALKKKSGRGRFRSVDDFLEEERTESEQEAARAAAKDQVAQDDVQDADSVDADASASVDHDHEHEHDHDHDREHEHQHVESNDAADE